MSLESVTDTQPKQHTGVDDMTIEMNNDYLARVSKASQEFPTFTKDTSGYNYKYVSFDSIQVNINPILAKYDLLLVHTMDWYTAGGKEFFGVKTSLLSATPDSSTKLYSIFPIDPTLSSQDIGSARTYGMRYNVTSLLNLVLVGEDDDGSSATKGKKSKVSEKKFETPIDSGDMNW